MFCPKCGNDMPEGSTQCSKCGLVLSTLEKDNAAQVMSTSTTATYDAEGKKLQQTKQNYFVMGIVIIIAFSLAALEIFNLGGNISQIESIGGQTLEEAYYAYVGSIYRCYAVVVEGMGLFFGCILFWLSAKR